MKWNYFKPNKEQLEALDLINTLNGGITEPKLKWHRKTDHYRLDVVAPGVSRKSLHVDVNDNQLLIYNVLQLGKAGEDDRKMPHLIQALEIPFDVNIREIGATYQEGRLRVYLPFNQYADGFHKSVEID